MDNSNLMAYTWLVLFKQWYIWKNVFAKETERRLLMLVGTPCMQNVVIIVCICGCGCCQCNSRINGYQQGVF